MITCLLALESGAHVLQTFELSAKKVIVCVCVCACVRACVRACVCVCLFKFTLVDRTPNFRHFDDVVLNLRILVIIEQL